MLKYLLFFCLGIASLNAVDLDKYKDRPLELIAKFIKPNCTIIEAGAHYGFDTMKFVETWPEATIYAFEPNPHAYDLLLQNTNHFQNVYPQKKALSNKTEIAKFYLCYGNTAKDQMQEGASSLLPSSAWMAGNYQGPVINVEATTLKDWCDENNVHDIDFIWFDMEGMELQVLSESPELLKNVKVIYTETNFHEFRVGMTQYKDLKRFLEKQGFTLLVHWPIIDDFQGNALFIKMDNVPIKITD